jgi:hypothetical protein
MKKKQCIVVCMLLIATALIPVIGATGSTSTNYPKIKATPMMVTNAPVPISAPTQTNQLSVTSCPSTAFAGIPVAATENPEYHPTIARLPFTQTIAAAYALQTDLAESNIIWTFSEDNGDTWDSGVFYNIEGLDEYPAIQYWGKDSTFIGTFKPDINDAEGSTQYLLTMTDLTDPNSYSLLSWDWTSYNQYEKECPDVATYSDVGTSTWYYGVMTDTESSDDPDYPGEHCPVLYFANYNDETNGWSWWWNDFENSANAAVDIDTTNGVVYAVWDYFDTNNSEQEHDILWATADQHDWWAENWTLDWYTLGDSAVNETYPDVGAEGNTIQIVAQSDAAGNQDIICYYSSDNGTTWDNSVVTNAAEDELYPRIVSYGDYVTVTFVKDGDLFYCNSEDGGATWSTPDQLNDNEGTIEMSYRTNDISTDGDVIWTDNRAGSGNVDVYYDSISGPEVPFLQIGSVTGGLGVKAVISNNGTLAASNVLWEITITGGILGRINKVINGTVATLNIGAQESIASGLFFGFGAVAIHITVTCSEGSSDDETRDGTQLIIWTKIK